MPYITRVKRQELKTRSPKTAGELNYLITKLAHKYLSENGRSYQVFNDIIGAIEGAKIEFYRREIFAYEDVKLHENGDVNGTEDT